MRKLTLTTYLAIRDIPVDELTMLLNNLSDASAAMILLNLDTDSSFELLLKLPEQKRNKIIQTVIDLENAEESLLNRVLTKIESEITTMLGAHYNQINTKDKLAELMCLAGSSMRTSMLGAIQEKKKSYHSQLNRKIEEYKEKRGIYFFEDILRISDEEIRRNIGNADVKKIAIALKDASDVIKEKIMRNISSRLQEMVADDMNYFEAATKEEIETAQQIVVTTLMKKF